MNSSEKTEFEIDLEIDKFALDAECLDQPRKFMKWSSDYADATAERDRADQKLEVIKAKVEQNIRKTPEKYGLEKATEAAIKAVVTVDGQVQDAFEEWVEAKHCVGILMAAREALEQRKTMLENLVKLFLSGYWADPRIPSDAKRELGSGADEKMKEGLSQSPRLMKKRGK